MGLKANAQKEHISFQFEDVDISSSMTFVIGENLLGILELMMCSL